MFMFIFNNGRRLNESRLNEGWMRSCIVHTRTRINCTFGIRIGDICMDGTYNCIVQLNVVEEKCLRKKMIRIKLRQREMIADARDSENNRLNFVHFVRLLYRCNSFHLFGIVFLETRRFISKLKCAASHRAHFTT